MFHPTTRDPASARQPRPRLHSHPRRLLAAAAGTLALVLASSAPARADDPRWALRVFAESWLSAGDQVTVEHTGGETSTQTLGDATGASLNLEFMLTRSLGLEAGAFFGDLDSDFSLAAGGAQLMDSEKIAIESFSLGANYHFKPGERLDFYVGALLAMSTFDDVIYLTEAGRRDKRTFDDDFGFGAKAGVDLAFGSGRWFLSAQVRYLLTILESEGESRDLDLDPLVLAIGFGARF